MLSITEQKSENEEFKLTPNQKLQQLVKEKMKERNLDIQALSYLMGGNENRRLNVINRLNEFLKNGVMRESTKQELYQVLGITEDELKSIAEYGQRKEAYEKEVQKQEENENQYFMENFKLLLENSELILGTPDFSNVTVPVIQGGLMYIGRHRPITLGELFFLYKKNHFIYSRPENDCCKKIYAVRIGGSLLSDRIWITSFCPECKKIIQFESSGAHNMLTYIKNLSFPYKPSDWNVIKLVDYLNK